MENTGTERNGLVRRETGVTHFPRPRTRRAHFCAPGAKKKIVKSWRTFYRGAWQPLARFAQKSDQMAMQLALPFVLVVRQAKGQNQLQGAAATSLIPILNYLGDVRFCGKDYHLHLTS